MANVVGTEIDLSQTFTVPALEHTIIDASHPAYVPPVSSSVEFSCQQIHNQSETSKRTGIPIGMLFTPVATLNQSPPCLRRPPVKCKKCHAYINPYCQMNLQDGTWRCCFCFNTNQDREEYAGATPETNIELVQPVVEYLDPTSQPFPVVGGFLEPAYAFLIDLSISKTELQALRHSLLEALSQIPTNVRITLIVFSSVVCVYELVTDGSATAHVLPGRSSASPDDLAVLDENLERLTVPIQSSLNSFMASFDAMMTSQLPSTSNPKRALGVAVETAMYIMGIQNVDKWNSWGKILIFLSGVPNYGLGALSGTDVKESCEYYANVSKKCQKSDISINIFCGGARQFCVKELHNLVLTNAGAILMSPEFSGPAFVGNLSTILGNTCGRKGRFTVRTSGGITIDHVIGSAVPSSFDQDSEVTALDMGGVQPRLCFSLFCEISENIRGDFVFFQFVVHFINLHNQAVQRVLTYHLPTTENFEKFLESVSGDVVSVLIAKQLVASSRRSDIESVLNQLDKRIHDIAVNCGKKDNRVYKLPPNLESIPKRLFMLSRGPLLGPILQHNDDIDSFRCIFFNLKFFESLRHMSPILYMSRNPTQFNPDTYIKVFKLKSS
eukprot:TRINITY_DN1205_c0_g1_i3.p1 TRINITY_DN1205_c0_g1~~TRINITY_DN1205_c0_g1_i3.p1  ORF type:complete len:611 (-),score=143.92 TRINITY_DN1205_c0_g1_i3:699-2531(-)